MQQSKHAKAMLLSAAVVGLGSIFVSNAHGAIAAYTWAGGAGGASVTWANSANWTQTGASFPQVAGDTASLNVTLAAAQTLIMPNGLTLGTLIFGDTSGSSFAQTLQGGSSTKLTLDNGGSGVTISMNTSTGSDYLAQPVVANDNVTFNLQSGGAKAIGLVGGTASYNFGTHTVTVTGSATTHQLYIGRAVTAALWVINSGGKINMSGSSSLTLTGDVLINAHGGLQTSTANDMNTHDLVVDLGDWNLSTTNQGIGGLTGDAGSNGGLLDSAKVLTINGGLDTWATNYITANSGGVPDFTGQLATTGLTVTGGTQRLSGTLANTTGPVSVTGGLLQFNKTGVAAMNAGLSIGATGQVQFMQSSQIPAASQITLNGGTLNMNGQSQTLTSALAMTASSTIDFGASQSTPNSILAFGNSGAQAWVGTTNINDWIGSAAGGGEDQLLFDASANLTAAQLGELQFINPTVDGVADMGTFAAMQLSTGEVVPVVPEPATVGLIALGGTILMLRRKRV